MKFMIYSDVPDDEIPFLKSALSIVSDNKIYKDLKQIDPDDISQLVCGYVAKNLWYITQNYKDCISR